VRTEVTSMTGIRGSGWEAMTLSPRSAFTQW
jgi:hypothetical protein